MNKRRVLIMDENSLFGDGVEQLLMRHNSIELVGAVSADFDVITTIVENSSADVLIINELLTKTHAQLIWQLLKTCPKLQIIVLSLEDNQLSVLNNTEVTVTTSADLIATIVTKT
jgi:DNA-binding NarL/FixJ family response regulator